MAIIAYLNFRGNTREAIDFYIEALDGKDLKIFEMGEMPEDPNYPMTPEEKKLVANASLKICGDVVMFSDIPDSMAEGFTVGNNVSMSIMVKDAETGKRYFDNLSKGGEVVMPLEPTSWSELYGFVYDKFGIGWQIDLTNDPYYYE